MASKAIVVPHHQASLLGTSECLIFHIQEFLALYLNFTNFTKCNGTGFWRFGTDMKILQNMIYDQYQSFTFSLQKYQSELHFGDIILICFLFFLEGGGSFGWMQR